MALIRFYSQNNLQNSYLIVAPTRLFSRPCDQKLKCDFFKRWKFFFSQTRHFLLHFISETVRRRARQTMSYFFICTYCINGYFAVCGNSKFSKHETAISVLKTLCIQLKSFTKWRKVSGDFNCSFNIVIWWLYISDI